MKRAVVTGGAGFIGSHLVRRLVSEDWQVTVIDNFSTGKSSNLYGVECDVIKRDINQQLPIIQCDVVFHLAAPVSVEESLTNPEKYYHQIVEGTENVLDWSVSCGCTSFVMASTAAIYGNTQDLPLGEDRNPDPMSPYAKSKLLAERIISERSDVVNGTAIRFFNVFGEGQRDSGGYVSVIPIFRKLWEAGMPMTVRGDGEQTRDFIWVEDIVDALIKAHVLQKKGFNVYNAGSGEETTVNQVAEAFGGEVRYVESIPEPRRSLACINKIRNELLWKPTMSVENWIETIR